MKVAVASIDDEIIASHFRQCERFVVVELQGEEIVGTEVRELSPQPHEHHGSNGHDHSDVVGLLADCCAVICGGMGSRIADDLSRYGIEPVVAMDCETPPETAAARFAAGRLRRGLPHACCCEH
jgi:predicted Fe-Mo cluster-binding NifX family protein